MEKLLEWKWMETINKKKQTVSFLEINQLFITTQYDLHENRSYLAHLIEFYDEVLRNFNICNHMGVHVCLDFQQAFDKDSH